MEEHHLLDRCESFVGVSVGAVILLLFIAGYSVYEIIVEASKANLLDDISSIYLHDVQLNAGLIPQRGMREFLERLIIAKFGKVLSMNELYQSTGLDFQIVTLELDPTNPHPVYLSHRVEPDISCVEASLLSANIPLIFQRLFYKGKCYIDGALGDPYPIHLLDDGAHDVLGLYVASRYDHTGGILAYLQQIFYSGMVQLRNTAIRRASPRCRHVGLTSDRVDPIGFTTTSDHKIAMVNQGYETAKRFFETDETNLLVAAANIRVIEEDN